jgi:autotransporter-associated beta strand protein
MKRKLLLTTFLLLAVTLSGFAQRFMDKLDRGLVAVKTTSGVYCSWRILGEEYYDVTYNIYRDGTKLNAQPLSVSNYTDAGGSLTSQYTVTAVVRGKEQTPCKAVTPWAQDYLVIKKAKRISNDGTTDITNNYEPNDATIADVDGDGQMEIIVKEINDADKVTTSDIDFDRIEVYKLDGTLLWWIDCGPNLWDFQHNETNIAAYDWDQDGKAECIMRAADGTVIHEADGTTYTIGDKTKNYRAGIYEFINDGAEYLVYMNGETGKPYYVGQYPLKRLEDGETNTTDAWGDGYGHRASKHFFGAPYFDGEHPSIFLARGIYTRHKMIAYDVDPATHQLKERWRWFNNTPGAWYGQGYHNYSVADVDWDGRDEIVFGSMVIDDDGYGLSTTGLGHGDSQHVGDFDPYKHGQEVFACNETQPANNYRDATTSKIYYRLAGGGDDGRALCGNFINTVPGAIGHTGHDGFISCVKAGHVPATENVSDVSQNFRIYWDGDLLDESFNGSQLRNSNGVIFKANKGAIKTFANTLTNNDTKATPCMQADIFGDWREEVIMRDDDNNMRIEFSTIPTSYRNYTLLHDPQYRNAMVWQMNGYNQTPHVSYFLGELEGITAAPPAPTTTGKNLVENGGTISTSLNDKEVMLCETSDATVTVADGAAPYIFFDNAPSWVKGHGSNTNITYQYFTHTLTGSAFTGDMRLVKLGDGALTLPKVTQTYSNPTEVWAGTINFDGEMQNSRVWLNRFAELNSDGGKFDKPIEMNYASILRPGGKNKVGTVTADTLIMNFGSRIVFDINDSTKTADHLAAKVLTLEKKDWENGPQYSTPVFEINPIYASGKSRLDAGKYELVNADSINGNVSDIVLTGIGNQKATLSVEDGKIYITIQDQRDATKVNWKGQTDGNWDLLTTENFTIDGHGDSFVTDDDVTFGDDADHTDINVTEPLYPSAVTFENDTLQYTLSGDSLCGTFDLTKKGQGTVTLDNVNQFKGTTKIQGGKLAVTSLANGEGVDYGALGGKTNTIELSNGATLAAKATMKTTQPIRLSGSDGSIDVATGVTLTLGSGVVSTNGRHNLMKTGAGALVLASGNSIKTLSVQGSATLADGSQPDSISLAGGAKVYDSNTFGSYSTNAASIIVPANTVAASFYMDPRCNYTGKLLGNGSLNVYATGIRNTTAGNWSNFEGKLTIGTAKWTSYDPAFTWDNNYGLPKATLSVPSGISFNSSSHPVAIGHLDGAGTISGTGLVTFGQLNQNETSSVVFSGMAVRKVGSGYWRIATTNPQASVGAVTIAGGDLQLNDTKFSTELIANTVTVSDSGRITGRGKLKNIIVNGGTLIPGSYVGRATGHIEASGNVTVSKGKLQLSMVSARNNEYARTYMKVDGTLTVNDSLVLIKTNDSYSPAAGDSITLWEAAKFSGTPKVSLFALPEGLAWDTSDLLKPTSVVRVVASSGIGLPTAGEALPAEVFTADGKKIGDITATEATLRSEVGKLTNAHGVYLVKFHTNGKVVVAKVRL